MTPAARHGWHWLALIAPPVVDGATGEDATVPVSATVEQRLQRALAGAGAVAWEWDVASGDCCLSVGVASLLALKDDCVEVAMQLVHPDDRSWLQDAVAEAAAGGREYNFEFRLLRPDGRVEWVRDKGQLERDGCGDPVRLAGVAQLITEQKRTQSNLRAIFEQAAVGMAHVAPDGSFLRVNDCLCGILGRSRAVLLSLSFQDITHPDDLEADLAQVHDLLAGRIKTYAMEKRYLRSDGGLVWARLTVSLVRDGGVPEHFISVIEDISERKQSEQRLARSEALSRAALQAVNGITWTSNARGEFEGPQPAWAALTGQGLEEYAGSGWRAAIHPEDAQRTIDAWNKAAAASDTFAVEHRVRRHDGAWRHYAVRARPIRTGTGDVEEWVGVHTDVTEQREASAVLTRDLVELERLVADRTRVLATAARELALEMTRREEMQAALLQARKLEALGQLVGGVAHDFNNILAAISGSYTLLRKRVETPDALSIIGHGEAAAGRAAQLIRQLLSFARKENLRPSVLNVPGALQAMEDLLRHSIGPSVRCEIVTEPGVWPVLADMHQFEIAVLNLAVNARDAMNGAGTLTISAFNLGVADRSVGDRGASLPQLPGRDHVVIAVQDEGEGMPPDVLARAIEPFFTTKPPGMGTGLGLSMAHGFAGQSGGALRVQSEPGIGTTVEIILPRADLIDIEAGLESGGGPALDPSLHGDASILLVEDNDQVRPLTARFLRDLGYTVLEAASAEAASVLVHTVATLDLVITDVSLPGEDGPTLAARLQANHPGLPMLFVTGYAPGDLLQGKTVLLKPFTASQLAGAVLNQLGRRVSSLAIRPRSDRLLARLRKPAVRDVYLAWCAAQEGGIPRLDSIDPAHFGLEDNVFTVEVESLEEPPRFRYLNVGRAVTSRLGRSLAGEQMVVGAGDEDVLGSLEGAYRRCALRGAPVFQSARYDFGDGEPAYFERLLLPFSNRPDVITHLIGVVQFDEPRLETN